MTAETDIRSLLTARRLTYHILGSAFLHIPTQSQIDAFSKENLFEDFPLNLETESFQAGIKQLTLWANQISPDNKAEILTQLKEDYDALFVGPDHLPAPPWESVYLTAERLTFGPPTLAVRKFFRRFGLEYGLKNTEPDDHFGLEMEFMAELIQRQNRALDLDRQEEAQELAQAQLTFLQDHLLKWADQFTADVIRHARTEYFQGMARIAIAYLNWDYHLLKNEKSK